MTYTAKFIKNKDRIIHLTKKESTFDYQNPYPNVPFVPLSLDLIVLISLLRHHVVYLYLDKQI
jgi:hypothetical protein